jgi:hypothetical protein
VFNPKDIAQKTSPYFIVQAENLPAFAVTTTATSKAAGRPARSIANSPLAEVIRAI